MSVRVAIAQMQIDPHSRAHNQRRAMRLLDRAAELDPAPEFICLPACCDSRCEPPWPTPAMTDGFIGVLAGKARELGVHVIAGLHEACDGAVYDAAVWLDPDGDIRVYAVTGELFFASTNELMHAFDYADTVSKVVVDLSDAHVWDSSAVATLDAVVAKFASRGVDAEIIGLNQHSEQLHTKLSGQLAGSH